MKGDNEFIRDYAKTDAACHGKTALELLGDEGLKYRHRRFDNVLNLP